MSEVKLLSEPTNYAVVQLPDRAFPGVVFQGDSLNNLIAELEEVAVEVDPNERSFFIEEVLGRLKGVRAHYEAVLEREGLSLPYSRR
jgi:predicted RNase H-like HicB family nuclease